MITTKKGFLVFSSEPVKAMAPSNSNFYHFSLCVGGSRTISARGYDTEQWWEPMNEG
jgi:hypothetical protein